VTQASPCPYCGVIGYHMWAGGGGCPGAVSERERDAAAALYLRALREENLRLQTAIGRYALLCGKAADALEWDKDGWVLEGKAKISSLIAELRKAAG
jgi:hypothetical protein